MSRPRAVIIGSGMGGLSCGVILAKQGYDVTVLEQGVQPGGCLQCFTRGGVRFETGMHFVGSADPGQTLHRLFDYLEILPDIQLHRLDTMAYNVISFAGERFQFANGREAFIETMLRQFPTEADSLNRYFDVVQQVADVCGLNQMQSTQDSDLLMKYQLASMGEVLSATVRDPHLRDVLCGDLPLYAGVQDKTPFALHAQLMDFYNRSSFRIRGGSDRLAENMIRTIGRYGGEVRTRSRVTRVLCDDTRATGVEVNGSEFVAADVVISAIHPQVLMPLLDTGMIRPAYRQRIASIPNTPSVFSLYLKFRPGAMPYMNSNFYGYQASHPWGCEEYDEETWPKGYLYMHFCADAPVEYAQSGVVLSYMHARDCARWNDTLYGRRGADYEAWKRAQAERLLDVMERDFLGIRSQIESYYTASPLTYRDYNSTPDGSMYGVVKDVDAGPAYRISYRTRVPNLLLVGQNINSHGILGVLVGTMIACGNLLGPGKIQIR